MFGSRSRIKCRFYSVSVLSHSLFAPDQNDWRNIYLFLIGTSGCHPARIHSAWARLHTNGTAFIVQPWKITCCWLSCVWCYRYIGRCGRFAAQLRRRLSVQFCFRLLQKLWQWPNAERFKSSGKNPAKHDVNSLWAVPDGIRNTLWIRKMILLWI